MNQIKNPTDGLSAPDPPECNVAGQSTPRADADDRLPKQARHSVAHSGEQSSEDPSPDDRKRSWHALDDLVPLDRYHGVALHGMKCQLAWALHEATLIPGNTPRVLDTKIQNGILWGQRANRDFIVYVSCKFNLDKVQQAQCALDQLKAQWPYRPPLTPPPKGYRYPVRSLSARREESLARACYEARILKNGERQTLRQELCGGGTIFGTFDGETFAVFFHEKVPQDQVERAIQALATMQPSAPG